METIIIRFSIFLILFNVLSCKPVPQSSDSGSVPEISVSADNLPEKQPAIPKSPQSPVAPVAPVAPSSPVSPVSPKAPSEVGKPGDGEHSRGVRKRHRRRRRRRRHRGIGGNYTLISSKLSSNPNDILKIGRKGVAEEDRKESEEDEEGK